MQWINKQNGHYRKRGHRIVQDFIQRTWNNQDHCYAGCNYGGLKSEKRITRLLLAEQNHYCCYCMRKIYDDGLHPRHTTLEHILPHDSKEADSVLYMANAPRWYRKNVKWISEAMVARLDKRVPLPPYPHFLAYENLAASCDGTIGPIGVASFGKLHNTCNNKRGERKIVPLFYMRHVKDIVSYDDSGHILFDERYKSTLIDGLNLDYSTLVLIRRAWSEIAYYHNPNEVFEAISDKDKRTEILEDMALEEEYKDSFMNDTLWQLLTEYTWFYQYYKKKRACNSAS